MFGGLGWFSDILEVEVEMDSANLANSHPIILFQPNCPLYSFDDTVSGRIKIKSPEPQQVWHYGITASLDCSVSFFESFSNHDIPLQKIEIAEPAYISSAMEYTFEFESGKFKEKLMDAYDGEIFCVRYNVTIEVRRPWYTFDVIEYAAVVLHRVVPAPGNDELDVYGQGVIERGGSHAPLKNEIVIGELEGKCKVQYGKKLCNIGDDFAGVLTIDPSIVDQVESVYLVLYKIEFGDGDENEINLIETVLKGQPFATPESQPDESSNKVEPEAVTSTDVAVEDASDPTNVKFSFKLKAEEKGPLTISATEVIPDEKILIGVRYFLRLVVAMKGKEAAKYWNTNEIMLYRSKLEPREPGSV